MAITVVSGLPRSGTSLMMQMLAAGGMPILTDGIRTPDANNPKGYFEYEPVKATARDASWVAQAEGKAVKVIYALLQHLPATHEYRIIMMRRDLDETLASQSRMLGQASDPKLKALFTREIEETKQWLKTRPNFRVLEIDHKDCLKEPANVATRINGFLKASLNETNMALAVDPTLYRCGAGS